MRGWRYLSNEPSKKNNNLGIELLLDKTRRPWTITVRDCLFGDEIVFCRPLVRLACLIFKADVLWNPEIVGTIHIRTRISPSSYK